MAAAPRGGAANGSAATHDALHNLSSRLQELVCTTFDPPAVENDEAIARAIAEDEEADARRRRGGGRPRARSPQDVSRDVAMALACQLDEIARGGTGALPAASSADEGLDAAVRAALGGAGVPALPWELGAAAPPPAHGGAGADLARLRERLATYGLEEGVFRALSDQLYRSEAYHAPVRAAVCAALRAQPERYAPYVVGEWRDYLEDMARPSTWGDHVTLQAAADAYGVRICVVTTYAVNGYLEIMPQQKRSQRSVWLSLHAEVHYNSVYPLGEVPRQGVERVEQLEAAASAAAAAAAAAAAMRETSAPELQVPQQPQASPSAADETGLMSDLAAHWMREATRVTGEQP